MAPEQSLIKAVEDWPTSKFLKKVQSFLGLAVWYRTFENDYVKTARPWSDLGAVTTFYGKKRKMAFENLKGALTNATALKLSSAQNIVATT